MRRHHNPNKVPPFKPDPEHWTRKVHSWKAKVAYETEDDAWEFLNHSPRLKALGCILTYARFAQSGILVGYI